MSSRACDYPSFSSLAHSSPVLLMSLSDIAPSVNYTLSLHDALPIYENRSLTYVFEIKQQDYERRKINQTAIENWLKKEDRKSTRLNSSHVAISSAVFCLKKKTRCAARWS